MKDEMKEISRLYKEEQSIKDNYYVKRANKQNLKKTSGIP